MSNTILQGNVAYVNHEKAYVMIEYEINGKKKVINGKVDDKTQEGWIEKKIAKKIHQFHIGDSVRFQSKLTDRGDKMAAVNKNLEALNQVYGNMLGAMNIKG